MKKWFYLLTLVLFIGCHKNNHEDDPNIMPSTVIITLTPSELVFDAEGGESSFDLFIFFTDGWGKSAEWEIVNECTWCRVNETHGYGGHSVYVSVDAFSEMSDRNTNLKIKSNGQTKILPVIQKHANSLILSKDKFDIPQEGGNIEIEVKSDINYDVVIPTEFTQWIKQNPASRAMTTKNFSFTISENKAQEKREGYIVFQGNSLKDTVYIYQEAAPNTLILSRSNYDISAEGETIEVELKTNIDYNVIIPETASKWISKMQTKAIRTDRITLKIEKNTTYDDRMAEIVIENQDATQREMLYIKQFAESVISLSRNEYKIPAKERQFSVEVESNTAYDILLGQEVRKWIQEMPQTKGLSTDILTFNISENKTGNTRTAEIIVKSKNSNSSDTLRITQLAKGETIVYTGDIIFRTEQDLMDFSNTGYTKVKGEIWIQGIAIHSLQYLDNMLTEIEGTLNVQGGGYTTLDGLRSLERISGDLIVNSVNLRSLEGLESLSSVGGDLDIYSNALDSFEGIENLENVGGTLRIYISDNVVSFLTSCKGFSKLQNIEKNFELTVTKIPIEGWGYSLAFKSLEGFERLETIGGSLKITVSYAPLNSLTTFKGLSSLKSIGGNIELNAYSSLTGLKSFDGLESLEQIGGSFKISTIGYSLNSLTSFNGLKNLKSIAGDFKISSTLGSTPSLSALKSFEGLEKLEKIGGDFEITAYSDGSLNSLASFSGLNSLKNINGNLIIEAYPTILSPESSYLSSFTSFSGLENLETIGGGKLDISYLKALNNIDALRNIKTLEDISITGCSALYDFCVLKNAAQTTSSDEKFKLSSNGYNPTKEQLLNGQCSQTPNE